MAVVAVTAGFGSPAIEFHDDPRLRGEQPPPAEAPPVHAVPDPELTGQVAPTVVLGDGLGRWVTAKLAGQPWYAEPQPSIRSLVEHAWTGAWTTSDWARARRLAWIYAATVPVRLGAWTVLRVWRRNETPAFGADQPPIRDLIRRARESGAGATAWICGAYLPARVFSHIADYATRTGVAVLMVWLLANAAGFPESVTVAHWWSVVSGWTGGAADTAGSAGSRVAELAGKVFGTAILLALGLWVLRKWWHNRNEGDT